jgi:hypothetical protein
MLVSYLREKEWLESRYAGSALLLVGFFLFTTSDALTSSCLRHGASPGQVVLIRNVSIANLHDGH